MGITGPVWLALAVSTGFCSPALSPHLTLQTGGRLNSPLLSALCWLCKEAQRRRGRCRHRYVSHLSLRVGESAGPNASHSHGCQRHTERTEPARACSLRDIGQSDGRTINRSVQMRCRQTEQNLAFYEGLVSESSDLCSIESCSDDYEK